ncbi:choice-of-anchor tandem repeat GloVer-containing protein [Methylocystis heyeri]|uniref:Uncharacterized protein n=1 Tax=Methylocystis heyeri TaxID=391905 RepID=A0A6B8K991_9HYPH|nr:choice-of-anchor tandem repeat GloVer-containing protein [Methylocystis heyeri]QGM44656.1 hypothetical protein H2LOC_002540 [Methylocystis heyeri]
MLAATGAPALAQVAPATPFSMSTLYGFAGGTDAAFPQYVTLAIDGKGALYGTSQYGGSNGLGAVFKLTPPGFGQTAWTETVIHSFSSADGAAPLAGLIFDSQGSLYGTTLRGGASANCPGGCGTAFKLTPPVTPAAPWTFTTIFNSDIGTTGSTLLGGLVFDGLGALYGSAVQGGFYGGGVVYQLTPSGLGQWTSAAIYNFSGADGGFPSSTLITDTSGALYGTTSFGGPAGAGVVFKLMRSGTGCTPVTPNLWCQTVLYAFTGGVDGGSAFGGVVMDKSGALYGATKNGGTYNFGVIFKLTPPATQWTQTTLYTFTGGKDGATSFGPLTLAGGALYGTTAYGNGGGCGGNGCGALFQLRPPAAPATNWTLATLHGFSGAADGGNPLGGLAFGALGYGFGAAVYGVTSYGGANGLGTIFALQCAHPAREVFGGAQHVACAQ